MDEVFENDMACWKLNGYVKNEDDQTAVLDVMRNHGEFLKNTFISIASKCNFPQINIGEVVIKFKLWGLLGTKHFNDADVHISCAGAINKEIDFKSKVKINGILTRFEFFDTIIRASKKRFYDSKEVKSVADAVEMCICEYIMENTEEESWTQFRTTKLWTLPMNDLFKANMEGVKDLWKRYHTPMKRTFCQEDATRLMLNDIDLGIIVEHVSFAWGMSQMTVSKELKHYNTYDELSLVEFMEFLSRIADMRYPGDTFPLQVKVKNLLEALFKLVHFKFVEYDKVIDEES